MHEQDISIDIEPSYHANESEPIENRYVFVYKVRIRNRGLEPVRLLLRHWKITDGNGGVREVDGMGVTGEQPLIVEQDEYTYTSGAVFSTEVGYMEGHYVMRTESDTEFQVQIPRFRLAAPNVLN